MHKECYNMMSAAEESCFKCHERNPLIQYDHQVIRQYAGASLPNNIVIHVKDGCGYTYIRVRRCGGCCFVIGTVVAVGIVVVDVVVVVVVIYFFIFFDFFNVTVIVIVIVIIIFIFLCNGIFSSFCIAEQRASVQSDFEYLQ